MGKSRLAMEMAEYASGVGFRCAVGHCYERDEPVPFLPFAEIIEGNLAQAASLDDYRGRMGENAAELAQIAPSLRRIFPDIPQPLELPPAHQRRYLFQSFSEALARVARTRPQLLVLEDLHWADESTLDTSSCALASRALPSTVRMNAAIRCGSGFGRKTLSEDNNSSRYRYDIGERRRQGHRYDAARRKERILQCDHPYYVCHYYSVHVRVGRDSIYEPDC